MLCSMLSNIYILSSLQERIVILSENKMKLTEQKKEKANRKNTWSWSRKEKTRRTTRDRKRSMMTMTRKERNRKDYETGKLKRNERLNVESSESEQGNIERTYSGNSNFHIDNEIDREILHRNDSTSSGEVLEMNVDNAINDVLRRVPDRNVNLDKDMSDSDDNVSFREVLRTDAEMRQNRTQSSSDSFFDFEDMNIEEVENYAARRAAIQKINERLGNPNHVQVEKFGVKNQCPLDDLVIHQLLSYRLANSSLTRNVPTQIRLQVEINRNDHQYQQLQQHLFNLKHNIVFDELEDLITNLGNTEEEHNGNFNMFSELAFEERVYVFGKLKKMSNTQIDGVLNLIGDEYTARFKLSRNIARHVNCHPKIYECAVFEKTGQEELIMTIPSSNGINYKRYPDSTHKLIESFAFIEPAEILKFYMKVHGLTDFTESYRKVVFSADGVCVFKTTTTKYIVSTLEFAFCERPIPCFVRSKYARRHCDKTSKTRLYQFYFTLLMKQGFQVNKVVADSSEMQDIRGLAGPNSSVGCEDCFAVGQGGKGVDYSHHRAIKPVLQSDDYSSIMRTHEQVMLLRQNLPIDGQINHLKDRTAIKDRKGETRRTPLVILKNRDGTPFDLVKQCCPDYFHLVCLGMNKFFLTHFFEFQSPNKFRDVHFVTKVDAYFKSFKTLSEFQRGIRSVFDEFLNFKGHEYKEWACYYAFDLADLAFDHDKIPNDRDLMYYSFVMSRYLSLPDDENEFICNNIVRLELTEVNNKFRSMYEERYCPTLLRLKMHKIFCHWYYYRKIYGCLLKYSTEASENVYGHIADNEKKCNSRKANTLSLKVCYWQHAYSHQCERKLVLRPKKGKTNEGKTNDSLFYMCIRNADGLLERVFYVLRQNSRFPPPKNFVYAIKLRTSNLYVKICDLKINVSNFGAYSLHDDPDVEQASEIYETIDVKQIAGKAIVNKYKFQQGHSTRIIVTVPKINLSCN